MNPVLDLTQSDVLTVLRAFLLDIVPAGVEVVAGQDNRVPEPAGANFVVMTPILRQRLSTNRISYTDVLDDQTRAEMQPTQLTVQLDVHGPASADNAQVIATLLRDDTACQAMGSWGYDLQPLYAGDPRQIPFLNGEKQYENRWIVDAVIQANPVVHTDQQFADTVTVGVVSVEATYPPEN